MPVFEYLMYVGETTNLQQRFKAYLGPERDWKKRAWIAAALERYEAQLQFRYHEAKLDERKALEKKLIDAYIPPLNKALTGKLGKAVRAMVD